jgi:hypothetical protein
LFREEVEEHNSTHPGAAVVDPSEELINVTNVFLRWYKLYRQTRDVIEPLKHCPGFFRKKSSASDSE